MHPWILTIDSLFLPWILTMKRLINSYLQVWKSDPYRKPLLLRGARQVGKTYEVRQFEKTYQYFVEINLEKNPV